MNNNNIENELDKYIIRQPIEILLSSKNGVNVGNLDGHKIYQLDKEITARKDEAILLYLKKCFVPFSFYCLADNQNNNKLDVRENSNTGATNSYTITIDNGNYAINDLLVDIKSKMVSNSNFNFNYSFVYVPATNKVSFILTGGHANDSVSLLFNTGTNKNKSICRLIGFDDTADITLPHNTTVKSTNVVDMADGLDSIHIKSDLIGENIRSTENSLTGGELLIIPVDLAPNSILYFNEFTPFKHRISLKSFKSIELNLTDNKDNTIDFNNVPYTFILLVEFIKDESSNITRDTRNLREENRIRTEQEKSNNSMFDMMVNRVNESNF